MKVLKHDHPYARMSKEEKEKVSILKLSPNRKHVKGVGMKDGAFYVIVEKCDRRCVSRFCFKTKHKSFNTKTNKRVLHWYKFLISGICIVMLNIWPKQKSRKNGLSNK